MKLVVVIPAYNEEKHIGQVIDGVKKYTKNIVVVDDASKDKTGEIAREKGAHVYRHIINRGLGGALGTGIKAALLEGADVIVTLDADGQHDPDDIPKLLELIVKGEADVVIGSRFIRKQKLPFIRRVANYLFNIITMLLFGVFVTDSQSGMRAFTKKAARKIKILTDGMEVSSEIIKEVRANKLRGREVPIKAIYTSYSLSKGQSFGAAIRTFIKLLIFRLTN